MMASVPFPEDGEAVNEPGHPHNGIGHFDVAGPDITPLKRFYASVFGWESREMGPGYALLQTPDAAVGGALVEAPDASFIVGVVVADLDAALEAAVAGGGTVVMPSTDNGFVVKGQVTDPAGNRITVIQG